MNVLIVCDKADAKLYESVINGAQNTSVLGTVTRITPDFVSVLQGKYNPHAVVVDTSVPTKNTDIKTVINAVSQQYPYMKILVLTEAHDETDYPSYCTVKGQISNIEIKKVLESMATGTDYAQFESKSRRNYTDTDGSAPTEDLSQKQPTNVYQSKVDNLSTSSIKIHRRRFGGFHLNPVIIAVSVAAAAVIVIIVAVIMKSIKGSSVEIATPDEAVTTVSVTEETAATESPGLYDLAEQYATAALETPSSAAAQPTTKAQTSDTKPKSAADADSEGSSKESSSVRSGSSDNSSDGSENRSVDSGGSSSGNTYRGSDSSVSSQISEVGGEPVISYGSNSYHNSMSNEVSGIKLSYSSKTMNAGDTLQLTAAVSPSTANQNITWSTSNSWVVSVNDGYLTARNAGTATVTARADNGVSASCSVTVNSAPKTKDVYLSASEYNLSIDQTVTITLYGSDSVRWNMDNNMPLYIVSHKSNYLTLRARATGTVKITAKDNSTGESYTCTVKVR